MYGELPEIETASGQKIPGIAIVVLNPPKTAVVRLPTNDELLTYLRAQRSRYRDLGRGMGEPEEVPSPKADLELFNAIRIDKQGERTEEEFQFDEAEALYALGIVTRHRVTNCERDGQTYVVKLTTMFGETEHTVRIPYQKELAEYRRDVYKPRDMPNNIEERRFPPEVPVKLYDRTVVEFGGYATDLAERNGDLQTVNYKSTQIAVHLVPPHHKRAVIVAVTNAIAALDPALDPNS